MTPEPQGKTIILCLEMMQQAASGQFLAYQLQQSVRKPRILLWAMSRISLLLPPQHRPLPTAIPFLLAGRLRNPCCGSREEIIFSCTEQMSSILSPHDIWIWGGGHEWGHADGNRGKGPGVLCRNPNLLLPVPAPKVISTHSSCGDFGGPGGHCCHCFLKTVDPAAAWAQPCSPAQWVDKEQVPIVFQPGWTGAVCRWFQG